MSDVVIVAIIVSVAPTLAVLATWRQQKKQVAEIHTMVNSRMEEALAKIEALEQHVRNLGGTP